MSKRVFVPPGCVSCELVMVDVGFLFITACKLFPSAECVWFCIHDFTVCFENLPRWMSIKVTTTRKKMASPEEKKKKYFAHVVAILNDSFERALEQDGCICKPLTVKEDCGLRTADCGLRTADCGLRTADSGPGVKCRRSVKGRLQT